MSERAARLSPISSKMSPQSISPIHASDKIPSERGSQQGDPWSPSERAFHMNVSVFLLSCKMWYKPNAVSIAVTARTSCRFKCLFKRDFAIHNRSPLFKPFVMFWVAPVSATYGLRFYVESIAKQNVSKVKKFGPGHEKLTLSRLSCSSQLNNFPVVV